jgi:hypothetical protein
VEGSIVHTVDVDESALEAHEVAFRDGAERAAQAEAGGMTWTLAACETIVPRSSPASLVRQKKKRENWL